MQQRPVTEPVDDVVRVGRLENVVERIGRRQVAPTRDRREQMQVVIAEHTSHAAAESHDAAHNGQRVGTAIHEIAHEPQVVA